MQRLGGMEKCASNAEAVHRGHDLLPNLSTLPHSAYDQFSTSADRLQDGVHRIHKPLLRHRIRCIYFPQVCQSISLR